MTPPEIVNLRTCKDFGTREGDVRIDRQTKYGNPFSLEKYGRELCITLYRDYLLRSLAKGELDLNELKGAKRLGCWCSPLPCHGDVLREYLIKSMEENYD